jgi:hypothetical protein
MLLRVVATYPRALAPLGRWLCLQSSVFGREMSVLENCLRKVRGRVIKGNTTRQGHGSADSDFGASEQQDDGRPE